MAMIMVRRRWLSQAILAALAMTTGLGCGGIRRIPVAGSVTLDGKPFSGGNVVFTPDASKGNIHRINCMSPIIEDGHYTLETRAVTPTDSGEGVPLGWYKVTFRQMQESTKKRQVIPVNVGDKFREPEKTPLSVEVKDNPEPGSYDIKFTSK